MNKMQFKNDSKGITLIALAITIIMLLIIASVTTYTGIGTIRSSKLNKFKQELEILQAEVNLLYEKYKDDEDGIKNIGKVIPTEKEQQAKKAFSKCKVSYEEQEDYRLFDEEIIKKLDIDGITREYIVNIKIRDVICLNGYEVDGTTYYHLEQLMDKNQVNHNIDRGPVTFQLSEPERVSSGWKINIKDLQFSKYVGKGKIQYKKVDASKWTTIEKNAKEQDYSFVVQQRGLYQIKVIDAAEQIAENTIQVGIDGEVQANVPVWNDGKATITLSTETQYDIEWQVNVTSGNWTKGTEVSGLYHNDKVYARLTNGVETTEEKEFIIVDTINPTVGKITANVHFYADGYNYEQNFNFEDSYSQRCSIGDGNFDITINLINGSDAESGHKNTKYTVTVKRKIDGEIISNEIIYEDISESITLNFANTNEVNFRLDDYCYITVTTEDNAGNISTSETYEIINIYHPPQDI